ncbi:murein hydrolase activator EnvC family protein [Streptomyces sp. NPDC059649]|uniref:murein hydrolase activator EnvC family protein n=1 Tax=Streptomyces sp. NPDC059649 TaxID=3346895 RepID=UPI00367A1221
MRQQRQQHEQGRERDQEPEQERERERQQQEGRRRLSSQQLRVRRGRARQDRQDQHHRPHNVRVRDVRDVRDVREARRDRSHGVRLTGVGLGGGWRRAGRHTASRFPSTSPSPSAFPSTLLPPLGDSAGYGPSCFFPARVTRTLLAPALTLALALTASPLAHAAASGLGSGVAAGRGVQVTRQGAEAATSREGRRAVDLGRNAEAATEAESGGAGGGGEVGGTGGGGAESGGTQAAGGERAWPVAGPEGIRPTVLRGWEPPPAPWAAGHRGVDLAASAGTTVRAAAPGQVAFAGTVAGRGVLTIEVAHSGHPPLRTTYEPVRATVRKGQRVTAGQPVAVLQRGPFHCRAPCLHWGLRRGKTYLDPLSLLPPSMRSGGPSRLLPVFGIPVPPGNSAETAGSRPDQPVHAPSPVSAASTARETEAAPTGAAVTGAVVLAGAALWALGRLRADRSVRRRSMRGGGRAERPG